MNHPAMPQCVKNEKKTTYFSDVFFFCPPRFFCHRQTHVIAALTLSPLIS